MREVRLVGEASSEPLVLSGSSLSVEDVVEVARARRKVVLSAAARHGILRCRRVVERLLGTDQKVYGLTTGFGALRDVKIPVDKARELQRNLIRSHASGVGPALDPEVVRAAILLRANTLARGNSGVRLVLVEALLAILNDGIDVHIPSQGSVGASGDLAPLSHMALVVMGDDDGKIWQNGRWVSLKNADRSGWSFVPVALEAKEGLALNNGTPVMTALAALACYDTYFLLRTSEAVAAISLEASQGVVDAYDRRIHEARGLAEQGGVAARVHALCGGSEILTFPVLSGYLSSARIRIKEAHGALTDVIRELVEVGADQPWPLTQLSDRLWSLSSALEDVLPDPELSEHAEWYQAMSWTNRSEMRARLNAADALLTPLRREATSLVREVQSLMFPDTRSRSRLEGALTDVAKALKDAVPDAPLVQDDYCLRCFPQVAGGAWRALDHVWGIVEAEVNAATDNPLLFVPPGLEIAEIDALEPTELASWVISGGNFHGQPIATAADYLTIAIAEIGSISERRVAHLVDRNMSRGLPAFLVHSSGLNSGFMIPQYTAASLVSENKVLCHPASVDSIPTCAGTEDHVSMGTIAARKLVRVLEHVQQVVAIELAAARQGIAFRLPLRPGNHLRTLVDMADAAGVQFLRDDNERVMADQLQDALSFSKSYELQGFLSQFPQNP